MLRRKTTESGTLLVKKPGRMRWEYKTPEEKLFVADGRKLYAWVPADRQVTVSALPTGDAPATPILFLLGRGQLARDFTPSLPGAVTGAPADSVALALVPKTPVPDYDRLTLVVDRATLGLRMLIARDAQGGTSTFVFTNLRENVGLRRREVRLHDSPGSGCCRAGVRPACAASSPRAGAALLVAGLAGCASTSSLQGRPRSRARRGLRPRRRRVREGAAGQARRPDGAPVAATRQAPRGGVSRPARPAPGRHRQARRGADRAADRGRAEPGQRRHRHAPARACAASSGPSSPSGPTARRGSRRWSKARRSCSPPASSCPRA